MQMLLKTSYEDFRRYLIKNLNQLFPVHPGCLTGKFTFSRQWKILLTWQTLFSIISVDMQEVHKGGKHGR